MIDRVAMMESLIVACPGFAPTFDAFLAEWADEPELPYYLPLGDFSRYLIQLLANDERDELITAFRMIEQLHVDGDKYVREAATIGILENLQNTNLHGQTKPDQFLEFLRPVSLKFWRKVMDFWENGTIITDD
ncbi:MAG: hypothetical protein KF881_12465 [Acidobacteria bacterium]|nr:hypothetical protein [Acidobacteriota bacterium]